MRAELLSIRIEFCTKRCTSILIFYLIQTHAARVPSHGVQRFKANGHRGRTGIPPKVASPRTLLAEMQTNEVIHETRTENRV